MPPKKEKSKLSKAEKEKLKAEEEQRKAEEEEEARAKAEEEEKARKAREQEADAQRKKLEQEEKKNRTIEMNELVDLLESNKAALHELHDHRRKNAKWARYMRCDGSPDPTIPGEINTYINLRLEDNQNDDIENVLKHGELDIALIQELKYLLQDTPKEELSDADKERYQSTKGDLQQLMKVKLDAATLRLLQEATQRADQETFNLQQTFKNDDVILSVWGNLSKNPRIKQFEFTEQGITFDIPRLLTLSDCAFRIMDVKYDHYSPQCKSFYPRLKKKEEPVAPPEEETQEEEKPPEDEEKKEDEEEPVEREETDLMAALMELQDGPKDEEEEEKKEEEPEEEVEEYQDPPTPEPQEWEDFEEDDDVIDLRANHIVGGVFHFDLMALPPQPKNVNSWVITRLVDPPEIEYIDYVADIMTQPPKESESNTPTNEQKEKEKDKQQSQEAKRDEKPPITVIMRLPDDVLFSEEPLVAKWDDKKKQWRQDGFSDMKYDEDKREFTFKTAYFGTMALLQDAHLNMPFQSWEIRPHKANSALFTIIAAIVEIEIEIKAFLPAFHAPYPGTYTSHHVNVLSLIYHIMMTFDALLISIRDAMCCLSKPDDKPELNKIRNKWVTPKELISIMRAAGVNVFPAEDSSKYVSIQNKHEIVEDWAYKQIALLASGFAFSWSKWNGECENKEMIMFQGSEALQDEPLLEEDWAVYTMNKTRAMKLQMTEFDENYSEEMAEGTLFSSNLYHLLKGTCSAGAKERLENTDFQFVDCVQQILAATKVLTYA